MGRRIIAGTMISVLILIVFAVGYLFVYLGAQADRERIAVLQQVKFSQITQDDTRFSVPADGYVIALFDNGQYITKSPITTGCYRLIDFKNKQDNVYGFAERIGEVCQ